MRKIPIATRERPSHALCRPSFRITRSAIFLLLVLVLKMPATAFAQDSTFTISLQHARLETVFQILQEKGNYNVLYNNERISKVPLVNLSLRNASVEQVLDSCFAHMPFSYSIRDRTIVISSGKKTAADTPPSKVNGTVTDNKGTPLAGVTVTLKNSTIATVTNEQGEYKLAVPGEAGTLIFSSVGYTTREAAINHRPEINIALENSVASLDQLVVVRRRADLVVLIRLLFSGGDLGVFRRAVGGEGPAVDGVAVGVAGVGAAVAGAGVLAVGI